ncbi:MAG: hypothetical protein WAW62_04850 [Candidatus Saccharimonas aalborgensis]
MVYEIDRQIADGEHQVSMVDRFDGFNEAKVSDAATRCAAHT